VRAVTVAYLKAEGHSVQQADSGREAIELMRSIPLDLLITDRAMPGMSGDQVAAAAKHLHPNLPVILLTGFGGLMLGAGETPPWVDCVLGKPMTLQHLRQALGTLNLWK
jgi:CheY-like chemotaxis protein